MDVIYYASKRNKKMFLKIKSVADRIAQETPGAFCSSIQELTGRLSQIGSRPKIAVLAASSDRELDDLLSVGHLIFDTRIILILPDTLPDTVSKGLVLFPRFFTSMDDDMETVFEVLKNLVSVEKRWTAACSAGTGKRCKPNIENLNPGGNENGQPQ